MNLTSPKPYLITGQIPIPVSAYAQAYKEALRDLRRTIQVPGFRPGHVPVEYVRSRYGQEVLKNVLSKTFLSQFEKLLGEKHLIGIPYYEREPSDLVIEPPYADYTYTFQALVRPAEPLPVQGPIPPSYKTEMPLTELDRFQNYLRTLLGEKDYLKQLPPEIPPDKELYVEMGLYGASHRPLSIRWLSPLQPFPYSYLGGRAVGDKIELPASLLMPYVEAIRAKLPDFSPLTMDKVSVEIYAAALVTPATEAQIAQALQISEINPEVWQNLFEKWIKHLLEKLNEDTFRYGFLHAAGVEIPPQLAGINYLFYRQVSSQASLTYEEYVQALAWRVFLESYMGHVPELEVPDEDIEAEVWGKFKSHLEATEEGQALLAETAEAEDKKHALVQALIGEKREDLRHSLRYKRFEKWLLDTYGPQSEKSLPVQTILLAGL